MRRAFATTLVLMAVPVLAGSPRHSAASFQQPKNTESPKADVVETIDPRGEPKPAALRSIPGPKACVAYERDGWQVQLRPGDADWTRIDGTREVVGGEIDRVSGFADLEYGIGVARRAGLTRADVFNTLDADEVAARFAARQAGASS